jgi:hypothetical protein
MSNAEKIPVHVIPDHRRELYFRIIDGSQQIEFIGDRLGYLDIHFPADQLDAGLKWLIKNRFVGLEFIFWFNGVCAGSDLEMHRRLLAVVLLQPKERLPLFAGKNFRL